MKGLDEKCILVQLTTSAVGNTRKDAEITNDLCSQYGIEDGSGTFSKKLYGEFITPVRTAASNLRKYFNEKTYPWSGKQRLCPLVDVSNPKRLFFKEFEDKVRELIQEYDRSVEAFISKYDDVMKDAEKRLGRAFSLDDYPPVDKLAAKFGVQYEVTPVPSDDFRVGVSSEMETAIREKIQKQNEEHLASVSLNIMNDARDLIQILLEKITGDKPSLKVDTMAKIQATVENLRAFPVTAETQVVLDTINSAIMKFSASAITGNAFVQNVVREKVEKIAADMGVTLDAVVEATENVPETIEPDVVTETIEVPKKKSGKKSLVKALHAGPPVEKTDAELEAQLDKLENEMAGAL